MATGEFLATGRDKFSYLGLDINVVGRGDGERQLGQGVLVQTVESAGELERLLAPLTQEVDAALDVCHGSDHE